jgi:hypothetical protein
MLYLEPQWIISRAINKDASFDLSSYFDMVNVKHLVKRMRIIGLPEDVIESVKVWVNDVSCYISIWGENLCLFDLLQFTVQGSVLGPVIYAKYVSTLFNNALLLSFADDSHDVKTNSNKRKLVKEMKKPLVPIIKCLNNSGLKMNDQKTDFYLFLKTCFKDGFKHYCY